MSIATRKTKKKLGLKPVNSNHYVACYHAGKVIPPNSSRCTFIKENN